MLFKNKYGYFDKSGDEYVITTPLTPRPWSNVIANPHYGLVVTQSGTGFSWIGDSVLGHINRWEQDLLEDRKGKFFFVKDEEDGSFWSLTWKPLQPDYEFFNCRVGFGYMSFETRLKDISSRLIVFVPWNQTYELWSVQLKNEGQKGRRLSIVSFMEWHLDSKQQTHREFNRLFLRTEFVPDWKTILANRTRWDVDTDRDENEPNVFPWIGFHSIINKETDISYQCAKENFYGAYGDWTKPDALRGDFKNGGTGWGYEPIASLKTTIDLPPGEEKTMLFIIGAHKKREDIFKTIEEYGKKGKAETEFQNVKEKWHEILSSQEITSHQDTALDLLVNRWLKYQAISGRLWGRTGYYQQSGALGFRDQLQDSQIFLSFAPQCTAEQIKTHTAHQFRDGSVLHWWFPLTDKGIKTAFSDDYLWLPFVTLQYLKETADWDFLRHKARYYDSAATDTIYEHCKLSLERSLNRRGKHGLPLMGSGDWNDGLSAVGKNGSGESVWVAHFLHYLLKEFSVVAERTGEGKTAELYRSEAESLKKIINETAWDGSWYIRAYLDDGTPIGCRNNKEGRIFLNAQTWAIISGTATGEKARKCMEAAREYLYKDYGPLLFSPAYKEPDARIGYLTQYAPGSRENGGVYTHAACWAIIAETILGNSEIAYNLFKKIAPPNRLSDIENYGAEPYVTPGNIDGPESPYFGRGGWTWYTGSAAWLYIAITRWILGIHPTYDGLMFKPSLPPDIKEVTITRKFRGSLYKIQIRNRGKPTSNKMKIFIDGEPLGGDILKTFSYGNVHKIQIDIT